MTTPTNAAMRTARVLLEEERYTLDRLADDIDENTGLPLLIAACKAADDAFDIACDNASNPDAMNRWLAAKESAHQLLRSALKAAGETP